MLYFIVGFALGAACGYIIGAGKSDAIKLALVRAYYNIRARFAKKP